MKEDISQRIYDEGLAEGREEGEALLEKAIRMLKEGAKEAEILAAGIKEQTINKAKQIISL